MIYFYTCCSGLMLSDIEHGGVTLVFIGRARLIYYFH